MISPQQARDLAAVDGPVPLRIVDGMAQPEKPLARGDLELERRGPSYIVTVTGAFRAVFVFRDVRVAGELAADVSVSADGRHLFRSTSTLSLAGRDRLMRSAAMMSATEPRDWQHATYKAVEAVLAAEEQLGGGVDLRMAPTTGAGPLMAVAPLVAAGPSAIVMPGEGGKSTIARAIAVSVVSGAEVIPGVRPSAVGPVLYVAAEDPVDAYHARSMEAICRGFGLERRSLLHSITHVATHGRPLRQVARSLAERGADCALIVLDSLTALLSSADGGIRERDSEFWTAVDELSRPTLILAHPNLSGAKSWDKADGRVAGSEVNRDRMRMAWLGRWKDEPAAYGTSFRRYTFHNTKWNNGPRFDPLSFAVQWEFGNGDDPGAVHFTPSPSVVGTGPAEAAPPKRETKANAEAREAFEAGATTPGALAQALSITPEAAKKRLQRLRPVPDE